MKTALMFLAVVAFATATQIVDPFADRSLSSTVVGVIEGMRDQMPCGFPALGIPPLAPLKINHLDVNIDHPALKMEGSVDNFRLNGLNDFDVEEMRINAITSKVDFRFLFRDVNVDTLYNMKVFAKKFGFTINLVGNGPARFAVRDIQISGLMKYSLGILSGKLRLKTLDVRTHIGEVDSDIQGMLGDGSVNHMMNDLLTEVVEVGVNSNEDLISETIEDLALPVVNGVLEEMALSDIVGAIGGGDDGEKEACIPPE